MMTSLEIISAGFEILARPQADKLIVHDREKIKRDLRRHYARENAKVQKAFPKGRF